MLLNAVPRETPYYVVNHFSANAKAARERHTFPVVSFICSADKPRVLVAQFGLSLIFTGYVGRAASTVTTPPSYTVALIETCVTDIQMSRVGTRRVVTCVANHLPRVQGVRDAVQPRRDSVCLFGSPAQGEMPVATTVSGTCPAPTGAQGRTFNRIPPVSDMQALAFHPGNVARLFGRA